MRLLAIQEAAFYCMKDDLLQANKTSFCKLTIFGMFHALKHLITKFIVALSITY